MLYTPQNVLHAIAFGKRLSSRSSHSIGRGQSRGEFVLLDVFHYVLLCLSLYINIESIAAELFQVGNFPGDSLWARLGSDVYEDGRGTLQYRRES